MDKHSPQLYPVAFWGKMAGFCGLACLVGYAAIRMAFSRELGEGYEAAEHAIENLHFFLLPTLMISFLAVFLVASVSLFFVGAVSSHRVAGPLFRLQRIADHLRGGGLTGKIKFRKKDLLKQLAENVDGWIMTKKNGYYEKRRVIEDIERFVDQLRGSAERGGGPELTDNIEKLGEYICRLNVRES